MIKCKELSFEMHLELTVVNGIDDTHSRGDDWTPRNK